ncbi:MAG: M24 family metallopeptidase [Chloroflexota bacterium]|nr:M24 family metallopeptidase [Chloroflexota bacterium]
MPDASAPHRGQPVLFYADSYRFPDVYHATGFLAPDPFITLDADGEVVVVTSSLEYGRAEKESRATTVRNMDDFGLTELSKRGVAGDELAATICQRFLEDRRLRRVAVPGHFPIGVADRLRAAGIELIVDNDVPFRRRRKRPDEVAWIEATQRATEAAWAAGVAALRRATISEADGTLAFDGTIFTAERLRAIVETELLGLGCATPESTITAPGKQAADPHAVGSGPLRPNEAIVMDIYPMHAGTRYYADMTRTVSKGLPSDEIVKMYEVVKRAQDAGIAALRPGIIGREVHELVEDVIFEAGYDTLRPGQKHDGDGGTPRGFIHGTGHGVGLQIHEAPTIGRGGTKPLEEGDVVTVEPGIYDPAIGGVRLEDMLVITRGGARNLTTAPRELVI